MRENVARMIVAVAQEDGVPLLLRKEYSGRGMYGSSTAGVIGDLSLVMKYALKTMRLLVRLECGEEDDLPSLDVCVDDEGREYDEAEPGMEMPTADELEEDAGEMRTDSMGREMIAY